MMTKQDLLDRCLSSKSGYYIVERNFAKCFPNEYDDFLAFDFGDAQDLPFKQRLYNYLYDLHGIPLTMCGKKKSFRNFRYGYNDFCKSNCTCSINHANEKRVETSLQRYGVENPNQLDVNKEKISKTKSAYTKEQRNEIASKKRSTLFSHYSSAEIGELIKSGVQEKYGVDNPSQIDAVKEKVRNTHNERYGGVGFASKELLEKSKKTRKELYGDENYRNDEQIHKTCDERYGSDVAFGSKVVQEKIKETLLERYGVDNASKNEDVKKRISKGVCRYKENETKKSHPEIMEVKESTFLVSCSPDCACGGSFEIDKHLYFQRKRFGLEVCTYKNKVVNSRQSENDFASYVSSIFDGEVVTDTRKVLGGKEIDVYLPELKIGFEFNGDYWHGNPNTYMYNFYNEVKRKTVNDIWNDDIEKTYVSNCNGISLYTIWEYDWKNRNEYIKSKIKYIIENNVHTNSAYYELKSFIDTLGIGYDETTLGEFHIGCVIIKYIDAFYYNSKTISRKDLFLENGKVVYVYDYEVRNETKFNVLKDLIRYALGLIRRRVFARKCELREITNKEAKPFLEENCFFGNRNAALTLGLYYEDELVMVYSFGYNYYGKNGDVEVLRVCTKNDMVVVGGSSKCLDYFFKNHSDMLDGKRLVFYVDRIHHDGSSLKGFKYVRHEYGVMNYWNYDYDDGELRGESGNAFGRTPSKNWKIKKLIDDGIITSVDTMGVDVYYYEKS